jgi:hypothetical protein
MLVVWGVLERKTGSLHEVSLMEEVGVALS